MTFDKATYKVQFEESNNDDGSPDLVDMYAFVASGLETSHVGVVTEEDDGDLIVVVHGDGYVIPVWEEQFRSELPSNVNLTCDVDIGGGDRTKVNSA